MNYPVSSENGSSSSSSSSGSINRAINGLSSTVTLYELCDRSYVQKHCPRTKKGSATKSGTDGGNPPNNVPTLKETVTKRVQTAAAVKFDDHRGGSGPRLELVNGKMVVKESSLVSSIYLNFHTRHNISYI